MRRWGRLGRAIEPMLLLWGMLWMLETVVRVLWKIFTVVLWPLAWLYDAIFFPAARRRRYELQ